MKLDKSWDTTIKIAAAMAVCVDYLPEWCFKKKRFYWSSEAGVEMECKEAKEASQVKRMSEANERKSEATVATGE
jgi:hypothetical protein